MEAEQRPEAVLEGSLKSCYIQGKKIRAAKAGHWEAFSETKVCKRSLRLDQGRPYLPGCEF